MAVTSIVRDRGRAFVVVAALTASVALASAPTAIGAVDGDPIDTSTDAFKVKLSGGFKKQLKRNGVKMKPKKLTLRSGDVDPTTGAADLRFSKKITFKLRGKGIKKCKRKANSKKKAKQCKKGVVYRNLKGSLPGNVKGTSGKLFKLTAPTVARNGFGADLSGIKVKFLKAAAKKLNKRLKLNSLHKGNAGTMTLSYQPRTVKVLSGEAIVSPDTATAAGSGTVASKLLAHCIDPLVGVVPIAPATEPGGATTPFHLPVTGGAVSPAGNDGVIQLSGGIRLQNGRTGAPLGALQPASCPAVAPGTSTSTSYLDVTNLAPNLGLLNIQSNAFIGGINAGCWSAPGAPPNPPGCGVFPGDKGPAIGQVIDASGVTVNADPNAKTVTINGAKINNNATSALVLNGLFPLAGTPSGGGVLGGAEPFADGDKFGSANLTVKVR